MDGRNDATLFAFLGLAVGIVGWILRYMTGIELLAAYASFPALALFITAGIVEMIQKPKREREDAIQRAQNEKDRNEYNAFLLEWKNSEYTALLQKYNVTKSTPTVTVKKKRTGIENYIFVSDNKLCVIPVFEEYGPWNCYKERGDLLRNDVSNFFACVQIPFDKIEWFNIGGDFYREQKITGGGGGGSDLGGAIIGGAIAGGVGAVIGSRKESEAIKSELVEHDTRETVLSYFSDNENRQTMVFKHEDYQTIEDLIPEKNYAVVSEAKKQRFIQQSIKVDETKEITEKIKELAKLKDDGVLTEEEFADKKKELLAKI